MSNRKGATALLLEYVDMIVPDGKNKERWEARLKALSDKEFEAFMVRLENGEEIISVIAPNFDNKSKVTLERNMKVAKKMGHDFFQYLYLTDPVTGETYKTPVKYMVVDMPLRRQIQTLSEKISISDGSRRVDDLTGQPVSSGTNKVSSISFPQIQALYSQNLDASIEELIRFRGGDEQGFRALERSLQDNGGASIEAIRPLAGKVKSTQTLSTMLKAMHIDNNA